MGVRTQKFILLAAFAMMCCAPAACALDAGDAAPPALPPSVEELRAIDALIAQLDDDNFDARQNATVKLAALGERIRPVLQSRIRARPRPMESPELIAGLKRVLLYIQRLEDARSLDEATRNFDQVLADAPLQYLAPDPSVDARMQVPISFDFAEVPLDAALELFKQQTNAVFFVDPAVAGQTQSITLRVNTMKSSLALQWVARLLDCETVVRGHVVVIATKEHAARLRLRGKTLSLPAELNGTPWTTRETELFTQTLTKWTLHDSNTPEPPKVTVIEGGKFDLVADRDVFLQIEPLLETLGATAPQSVHFQPLVQEFFTKMNQPLKFSLDKKETIRQASEDLAALMGFEISAEEVGVGVLDQGWTSKDATGFDYVAKLCELGKISASHSIYIDKNHIQLMAANVGASELVPCVLDLRPALKAGASEAELVKCIDKISRDAKALAGEENAVLPGNFVRGCCLTMMDVWNARRVAAVIDGAAKTGKVPDAPPLPEFLKRRLPGDAAVPPPNAP